MDMIPQPSLKKESLQVGKEGSEGRCWQIKKELNMSVRACALPSDPSGWGLRENIIDPLIQVWGPMNRKLFLYSGAGRQRQQNCERNLPSQPPPSCHRWEEAAKWNWWQLAARDNSYTVLWAAVVWMVSGSSYSPPILETRVIWERGLQRVPVRKGDLLLRRFCMHNLCSQWSSSLCLKDHNPIPT